MSSDGEGRTTLDARGLLSRTDLSLPEDRVRRERKQHQTSSAQPKKLSSKNAFSYSSIKALMHQQLLEDLDRREMIGIDENALTDFVKEHVQESLQSRDWPLNESERKQLVEDLIEETIGVGPLSPLLADPAVSDILVNSHSKVYVERYGRLEETDIHFRDDDHLIRIIQRIASRVGRRIDESSPMVDARLSDGSRVNATLPPVTIDGPTLSIRRFGVRRLRSDDLLQLGMFSPQMREFMRLVVHGRKNVLVSGGTGSGKSTFLGAMAEAIPEVERVVTIEDAAELQLDQRHVIRMETRPPNIEGQGRIVARDLLINSLRMRPDRIIIGEVRGPEALDMLQAMNTGHDGGMTTIHANSPRDALSRLETMVLMAGIDLPSRAIREQTASAIDVIIQVKRYEDGVRRVQSISELVGMEGDTPQLQEIFMFKVTGKINRKLKGDFIATGVVPKVAHELRASNVDVPMDLFAPSDAEKLSEW